MSSPSFSGQNPMPSVPSNVLAEFGDYAGAQALVDRLSDGGFPVEHVRIVGEGVRIVEQVTGRLTKGRAALLGAGSGAWFGLLIGIVLGFFVIGPAWIGALLLGLVIGAIWGAIFGFFAHWATRGRRDFSSVRGLEAERYAVLVAVEHFAEAQRVVGGPAKSV
ncbi:hypothetical protein SAMN04489806_0727 [Paramicrobacterium humi]|uniref:General stress protein 17M-like domain-containing protein n=1 Tax=Paramicrobacterium humi TaxID=640635 RepID=A0A1H4JJ44_9MICO|nr:general stress protein [Microbacterium humi]SEB46187.1 hypothetical protein SAMN04489806_0727 [Microbacterium humi]